MLKSSGRNFQGHRALHKANLSEKLQTSGNLLPLWQEFSKKLSAAA